MKKLYSCIIILIGLISGTQVSAQCTIGPAAIPDNGTATYTFSSQSVANWANFKVQVNFTTPHTWAGDLKATITIAGCASGNGTYTLFNFQSNNAGTNCDMGGIYTFIQTGSSYLSANGGGSSNNPIPGCAGGTIPVGTYTSAQQWPTSGSCSGGTITVTISDDQNNDVGTASVHLAGTTNCSPLPVSLINFSAEKNATGNLIRWTTASETNNAFFVVERSNNNSNWEQLTQVAGAINTTTEKQYSFIDKLFLPGKNYYRLKQVDLNGNFTYSKIVVVNNDNSTIEVLPIAPNPLSGDNARLKIFVQKNQAIRLTVTDVSGKTVYNSEKNLTAGINELLINTSNFSNGMYLLKAFTNDGYINSQKLIVSRTGK